MPYLIDSVCIWANRATSHWQVYIPPFEERKRILVVQCHPCSDSFSAACAKAALKGLQGKHDVRVRTLYADKSNLNSQDFLPALTCDERRNYYSLAESGSSSLAPEVADAVADLRWAQALVFVYPTWWAERRFCLASF